MLLFRNLLGKTRLELVHSYTEASSGLIALHSNAQCQKKLKISKKKKKKKKKNGDEFLLMQLLKS